MKKPRKPKCCQWMEGCVSKYTSTVKTCQGKPTFELWCTDYPVPVGWLCAEHAHEAVFTHKLGQIH